MIKIKRCHLIDLEQKVVLLCAGPGPEHINHRHLHHHHEDHHHHDHSHLQIIIIAEALKNKIFISERNSKGIFPGQLHDHDL